MKFDKLIPQVYYKESRDFSYIGRLVEILINYMKTNSDIVNINTNSENIDSNILNLLAMTLGFETKHKYLTKDLIYVCSSFTELVKNKGTKASIEAAIQLLLTSQGIDDVFIIQEDENDPYNFILRVPEKLTDTILLEDLFEYILPAGVTYTLLRAKGFKNIPQSDIYDRSEVVNAGNMNYDDATAAKTDMFKLRDNTNIDDNGFYRKQKAIGFNTNLINSDINSGLTGQSDTDNPDDQETSSGSQD